MRTYAPEGAVFISNISPCLFDYYGGLFIFGFTALFLFLFM